MAVLNAMLAPTDGVLAPSADSQCCNALQDCLIGGWRASRMQVRGEGSGLFRGGEMIRASERPSAAGLQDGQYPVIESQCQSVWAGSSNGRSGTYLSIWSI